MIKKVWAVKILFILLLVFSFANSAGALDVDPFEYFNVYSLGDMGKPGDYYPTDVQGTIGIAGNAYLGLAIGTHQINEYALHTGGDLYIVGGSMYGKLDVGGNASISNFYVNNEINAGGNVTLAQSTSGVGTVNAAGTVTKINPWNNIPSNNYVPYTPMFDFGTLNQYFLNTSSAIGNMPATGAQNNYYSTVYFDVDSGVNVFNINATDMYKNMKRVVVKGPADATVYINATDTNAYLGWSLNWDFEDGVSASNVLLNFPHATDLRVSGGEINVLAPKAETYFPGGAITGNLIVGDLPEGWQVNSGYFAQSTTPIIPEPSSVMLFSSGIAFLFGYRKKSKL